MYNSKSIYHQWLLCIFKQTDIYLNLGKHISGGPHVCLYGYNCDVTYRIIEVEFFQYDAKSAIFQKFSDMVTVVTSKQHN